MMAFPIDNAIFFEVIQRRLLAAENKPPAY